MSRVVVVTTKSVTRYDFNWINELNIKLICCICSTFETSIFICRDIRCCVDTNVDVKTLDSIVHSVLTAGSIYTYGANECIQQIASYFSFPLTCISIGKHSEKTGRDDSSAEVIENLDSLIP